MQRRKRQDIFTSSHSGAADSKAFFGFISLAAEADDGVEKNLEKFQVKNVSN
jgi:hypothetical protein